MSSIVIGADHGGVELKDALVAELQARGEAAHGILVCTNGIGMSIAANKFPGVRAALVGDATAARMAREHIDANVLVFGGGMTGKFHARELLRIFLETPFAGGRHQRRVDKIGDIEHEVGLRAAKGALR